MTIQTQQLPLIAILRGVTETQICEVADCLIESGFTMIEVPLNSPNPIKTIQTLVDHVPDNILVGAGTVTNLEQANDVVATGAKLIVTPNYNKEVITYSLANACQVYCGVLTPTEAFNAIADGVTKLKIFPVNIIGLDGFKALSSVLPAEIDCYPVGGIDSTVESMKPYIDAGAKGFGLGSALYTANCDIPSLKNRATQFVETYASITSNTNIN